MENKIPVPVLITTSGLGTRLDEFTKFTNKALVKLGDKYAICYIIESYPTSTPFIITIGYFGSYVKQFITLAYPSRNFTFVEIDKYEGTGSSLAYSLLKTKNLLNRPFIFHCCDAIVRDIVVFDTTKNTLFVFVSKYTDTSQYATVNTNDMTVLGINSKGTANKFDYVYTGISYIKDFSSFWKNLEQIYTQDPNNTSLSDVQSLQSMLIQNNDFTYKELKEWFDTGNMQSYKSACEYFKSEYTVLEKNYESLCFFDNHVIKFINDEKINNKRMLRGISLYPLSPKIIDYSNNFIVMEKVDGQLLSNYYTHGEIYRLLIWANTYLWIDKKIDASFKQCCTNFYIDKTISRISNIKSHNEYNIINGLTTKPIRDIIGNLNIEELITDTFTKFHGDFILDNIVKTKTGYCLLDWRHEFDNQHFYGDYYYDLAKLRHNIIFNHDNIHNDLYTVKYINDSVIVDLKCNYFLMNQLEDFDRFIHENNLNMRKIKLLTALIWINMAPLYTGKLQEFLFYFGKYNLQLLTT